MLYPYIHYIAKWAVYQDCQGIKENAIINPSMNTCPICKTKLIPIVYGRLNPDILDMQEKGLLLIGMDKTRKYNSFCPLCEESYGNFTIPLENL